MEQFVHINSGAHWQVRMITRLLARSEQLAEPGVEPPKTGSSTSSHGATNHFHIRSQVLRSRWRIGIYYHQITASDCQAHGSILSHQPQNQIFDETEPNTDSQQHP